jgi:hypothetical protein
MMLAVEAADLACDNQALILIVRMMFQKDLCKQAENFIYLFLQPVHIFVF